MRRFMTVLGSLSRRPTMTGKPRRRSSHKGATTMVRLVHCVACGWKEWQHVHWNWICQASLIMASYFCSIKRNIQRAFGLTANFFSEREAILSWLSLWMSTISALWEWRVPRPAAQLVEMTAKRPNRRTQLNASDNARWKATPTH
jgi:hypothetical protein